MTDQTGQGGETMERSAQIHLKILNQERFLPFAKVGEYIGALALGVGLLIENAPTTVTGVIVAGASAGVHLATRLEIADLHAELDPDTRVTQQQAASN